MKEGIVVIGGHVQGLGIVRMAGDADIPVIVMDKTKYNIARYSKYVSKFILLHSIPEHETEYVNELLYYANEYHLDNWLLFPTDDLTVATLSKQKEKLSKKYRVWTSKWEVIKLFFDKIETYKLATSIGIPCPKSIFPKNIDDIKKISMEITYPVIIKPAVMQYFYQKTGAKVVVINSPSELIATYKSVIKIIDATEVIIQEIIPGSSKNLYSCGVFFKNGKIIASISGRRLRQIPMDFGKASSFVEIVNIPMLNTLSQKILSATNYYGMAEIEFKYDSRDGQYKLLEINPRAWKWHAISELVGIKIPVMIYNDLHNLNYSQTKVNDLNTHKVWIDEYTDFYISICEIIRGRMALKEYFVSKHGLRKYGVWSIHDIKPFIMETLFIPMLIRR